MKKFFKYNRVAAIGALVLIILLSVFCGVNRTVYSYKSKTENAFSSSDGSVSSDLKKYKGYAEQFCAVAAANGCDTGELEGLVTSLDGSDPFNGCGGILDEISRRAAIVHAEFEAKNVADSQAKNTEISDFAEMSSTVMRLQNNKNYNNAAAKYNKAKNSFPANILAGKMPDAAVFDR